ncbi:hypothetical protein [Paraburkholderia sp. BCC1885]|uniref:hypothetical protein n=1 Tax=Paraburkholderia sp. BCC1885 TaxID=2562669 RepID=UPI00118201BD|nr:hypothetical protein [Paraburkholderia sp. BCC1885]
MNSGICYCRTSIMYLLPHITPELIVLKHSMECGAPLDHQADTESGRPTARLRGGFWTRIISAFR